jgi:hypothetical protein
MAIDARFESIDHNVLRTFQYEKRTRSFGDFVRGLKMVTFIINLPSASGKRETFLGHQSKLMNYMLFSLLSEIRAGFTECLCFSGFFTSRFIAVEIVKVNTFDLS